LDHFEGLSPTKGRRGSNLSSHRHSAAHEGAHLAAVDSPKVVDEDEEDSLKNRLKKYRYVKKIEPAPEPLERLPKQEPLVDEGRLVLQNTSFDAVQAFSQKGRRRMIAEMVQHREQKFSDVRARRQRDEYQHELAGRLKVREYEERMNQLTTKQGSAAVAHVETASGPQRALQARKWQGALVMIGFMQMCRQLITRFGEVRLTFLGSMSQNSGGTQRPMRRKSSLAEYTVQHVLAFNFSVVAREHMYDEWRRSAAAQKCRPIWTCRLLPVYTSAEQEKSKADATKSQRLAEDNRKYVYVDVPHPEEMARLQRNSIYLEASLIAKFRRRRHVKEAGRILHSLQRWQRGKPLVALMAHIRRIKRIQRFVRSALRCIAEVRANIEAQMMRLEHGLTHAVADGAHQPAQQSHHWRMLRNAAHSSLPTATHNSNHAEGDGAHDHTVEHHGRSLHRSKDAHTEGLRQVREHAESHDEAGLHGLRRGQSMHSVAGRRRVNTEDPMAPTDVANHSRRYLAAQANLNDERRRRFIRQELLKKRIKYVPVYEVWQGDMELYRRDVGSWRNHCKECRCAGVKPWIEMPEMPPCPSYIPTEEELVEWVSLWKQYKQSVSMNAQQAARAFQTSPMKSRLERRLSTSNLQKSGQVKRMILAESVALVAKRSSKDEEDEEITFKADHAEGGQHLCEEVSHLLARKPSHPLPVVSASEERQGYPGHVWKV